MDGGVNNMHTHRRILGAQYAGVDRWDTIGPRSGQRNGQRTEYDKVREEVRWSDMELHRHFGVGLPYKRAK